jgi:hypothetical protein
MTAKNETEWTVEFLNKPPADQLRFLYRYALDEAIRTEFEKDYYGTQDE